MSLNNSFSFSVIVAILHIYMIALYIEHLPCVSDIICCAWWALLSVLGEYYTRDSMFSNAQNGLHPLAL